MNLEKNVQLNHDALKTTVHLVEFDWKRPADFLNNLSQLKSQSDTETPLTAEYDIIFAADVVWIQELIQPLVDAIVFLFQQNSGSALQMYLSNQKRSQIVEHKFFELLQLRDFDVQAIDEEQYHPDFKCKEIVIYRIQCQTRASALNDGK